MEEYYTAREAAEMLGLKYHTFMARVRKGQYNRVKAGWAVLFPKRDIDKHVDIKAVEKTEG